MRLFTTSPMLTIPTSAPASSTTGTWRMRRSVIVRAEILDRRLGGARDDVGGHDRATPGGRGAPPSARRWRTTSRSDTMPAMASSAARPPRRCGARRARRAGPDRRGGRDGGDGVALARSTVTISIASSSLLVPLVSRHARRPAHRRLALGSPPACRNAPAPRTADFRTVRSPRSRPSAGWRTTSPIRCAAPRRGPADGVARPETSSYRAPARSAERVVLPLVRDAAVVARLLLLLQHCDLAAVPGTSVHGWGPRSTSRTRAGS